MIMVQALHLDSHELRRNNKGEKGAINQCLLSHLYRLRKHQGTKDTAASLFLIYFLSALATATRTTPKTGMWGAKHHLVPCCKLQTDLGAVHSAEERSRRFTAGANSCSISFLH